MLQNLRAGINSNDEDISESLCLTQSICVAEMHGIKASVHVNTNEFFFLYGRWPFGSIGKSGRKKRHGLIIFAQLVCKIGATEAVQSARGDGKVKKIEEIGEVGDCLRHRE